MLDGLNRGDSSMDWIDLSEMRIVIESSDESRITVLLPTVVCKMFEDEKPDASRSDYMVCES